MPRADDGAALALVVAAAVGLTLAALAVVARDSEPVEDDRGQAPPFPEPVTRAVLAVQDAISEIGGQDMSNADANRAAFLKTIRKAEGTDGPNGYRTLFGGRLFDSFADHPRQLVPFTQTDGKRNYSSAAGAYQILRGTWDRLRDRLGLQDFSPGSQDRAALELIREKGALADLDAGRLDSAVAKVARVWASLPGSPYPQPSRSPEFVRAAFAAAGGVAIG